MKYPMINKQPRREVNVPALSGGLNLRDSLTGIRDNQLSNCVNMWYRGGMLRTRPSLVTSSLRLNKSPMDDNDKKLVTSFMNEIRLFYKDFECVCAANKRIYTDEEGNEKCNIEFEFQAVDKIFAMPKISGITGGDNITYFCAEMNGVLYCYVSDLSVWKLEYSKGYEKEEDKPVWEEVKIENRYIPTTYAHCQRTGWDDFKGTFFEGYNLIGNQYKMIYSAYNELDSDTTHPMRYKLGQALASNGEIKVEITSYNSENNDIRVNTHSIKYNEEEGKKVKEGEILIETFENGEPEDGLYLFARYNYVGFLFETEDPHFVAMLDTEDKVKRYGCNEDNVIITAPYDAQESDLKNIFNMTQCTWFGGTADGINDGSRLFVCGNTEENSKSLVAWSGLDNPLYFGENSNAYVGSKSRAVTAFGKQGENLIIFKENKIYATFYQQNTDIDADDLNNQSVVDYEANSVYFPMLLINGYIGCDCPNTIQMCRNRLVWTTSEGKVYMLCTVNQYNERTVYELSDMIAPRLKEYKNRLKNATSADFAGHYILFLGDCAWIMDYCSYGYQYVYSYSKNEDANMLIPWYFWDFTFLKSNDVSDEYRNACISVLGGNIVLRAYYDASTAEKSAFVGFTMCEKEYGDDFIFYNDFKNRNLQSCNKKINSSLTTKFFELGQGFYTANVETATVKLGANDAADVTVKLVTEQGEEMVILKDKREHIGITAKNFICGKTLRPTARCITKFGLEFECDGQLCIDGLSLKYRLLGGIK